jgi:uncharacterized protein (TIGR02284 family)
MILVMSDNKTIDTLNTLIETCKDGEYRFRTSAEHAQSADLKSLFLSRSQDCQRGASELQAIVARLGGKAEPTAASRARCTAAGSRWSER